MKMAFLYAGQGSQCIGMGADFYSEYPTYAKIIDDAQNCVDFDLKTLSFEGPLQTLSQTQFTQPCMVAFASGVTAVLKEKNIVPHAVAGLSLGEYSALQAAGVFTPQQAISLAAFRGDAMRSACDGIECGMAAILGLDRQILQELCVKTSTLGVVSIANYNCAGQFVISGEKCAVDAVCVAAKEAGAKRCLPLQVSGAFHTSLMDKAADALNGYFKGLQFGDMQTPVYFNTTAKVLQVGQTIANLLELQVKSSVYMQDTIENMIADGVDTFVEIGAGKVLSGFVKKTSADVNILAVSTVDDIQKLELFIKEN